MRVEKPIRPRYQRTSASFSVCEVYRYVLGRFWNAQERLVNFIMLNPSTADEHHDDATLRRCVGYARQWGFGGVVVTNLYAYRATDPRQLWTVADPVGPLNDEYLHKALRYSRMVVCAWGQHAKPARSAEVLQLIRDMGHKPMALKKTKQGMPAHPLRLPKQLKPQPLETLVCT